MAYRRFPYRTFFRWLFLLVFIALVPAAPIFVHVVGRDIEAWNIEGLNQSRSYQSEPGKAREVTTDWSGYWPWALGVAVVLLVCYLYVFAWASPVNDPKRST